MTRAGAAVAAMVAILLSTAACGDPSPSAPTPEDLARIDLSVDHRITVDETGFDPATLSVEAGDVVRLVNDGEEPHSFTSDDRFDTGRLQPGEDTTLVLTEPGEVTYRDLEAPDHTATITVGPRRRG